LRIINKVLSAFADELVTKFNVDDTKLLGRVVNDFFNSLDFSDRHTEKFLSPFDSFWEKLIGAFDIKDLKILEGVFLDFAKAISELEDIWKLLDDDTSDTSDTGIEGKPDPLHSLKTPWRGCLSKYLRSIEGMKELAISPATSRALATNCVIAVVGVTGSGKSSFIGRVTKRRDVKVGAGLFSGEILNKCTKTLLIKLARNQ
jgi:hypothetical protein